MQNKLNKIARGIIANNEYLTLATTNEHNKPWVCILAYSFDKDWNFYYVSIPSSNHGKNLMRRPSVSVSIFDSHQDWGKGIGLQINGKSKIILKKEFKNIANIYFNRRYPYGRVETETATYFRNELKNNSGKYRFYKIKPQEVWMNNPYSKDDVRVKINL